MSKFNFFSKKDQKAAPAAPDNLRTGETIRFGRYPQTSDGRRLPIEWTVLEITEDRALLLSRCILAVQPFHMEAGSIFWNSASLRIWLNHDFLKEAFSDEELGRISHSESHADLPLEEELWREHNVETETEYLSDRIFLLRWNDINRFFPAENPMFCPGASTEPTDYVKTRSDSEQDLMWWLRSSFPAMPYASSISPVNSIGFSAISPDNLQGVRPALWLKLKNDLPDTRSNPGGSFRIQIAYGEEATTAQQSDPAPHNSAPEIPDGVYTFRLICNRGIRQEQIQKITDIYANALLGNAYCAALLGVHYFNGDILKQDFGQAFRWYRVAAESGSDVSAAAQANLSDCYLRGLGVQQNDQKALEWMQKAADQGDANAMANLGTWYLDGSVVPQNTAEGERLLRASVLKHGHNWEYANKRLGLALIQHPDRKSKQEGLSFIIQAAEAGYPPAMAELSKIYRFGLYGMEAYRDSRLYFDWVQKGVNAGEPFCQASLAEQLMNGNGVKVNFDAAQRLAHASADQDCSYGCYISGLLHENAKEYPTALAFYKKAVALGDKAAEADVRRLESVLSNS